ncbi:MAG: reverse transcriptase domain-containing protein, partial [Gloeomargaritales cyanobacterium]
RDSCIYSHYRSLLNDAYEAELAKRKMGESVLAYRRIPKAKGIGNKSNIHFAEDVFSKIIELGDCLVYTLDISKFFETLDHSRLKKLWKDVMGFSSLPADHFVVFRNVTRYACVDRESLYRELGFIGTKWVGTRQVQGYLTKRIPLQVCSGEVFREKITRLVRTNPNTYGIPQGSPISDVLANLYLLDFDTAMMAEMNSLGGNYYRYSDDILLIVPGHSDDVAARLQAVDVTLQASGKKLTIQAKKSTVHKFTKTADALTCKLLQGVVGKNGLEYLGFRFDGFRVFIRDSTRSRLQRKMTFAVRASVRRLCKMNPGKGRSELKQMFNESLVLRQFYKVRDFETVSGVPKKWTFWTYVIRAQKTFGDKGVPIGRQLRRFKQSIKHKANKAIDTIIKMP